MGQEASGGEMDNVFDAEVFMVCLQDLHFSFFVFQTLHVSPRRDLM